MSLPNNQAIGGENGMNAQSTNPLVAGTLPNASAYPSTFPAYPYALNPLAYTAATTAQLPATAASSFNYPYSYQAQAAAAYNYGSYAAYYQQQGLAVPSLPIATGLPAANAANAQPNKTTDAKNKFQNKNDKKAKQNEDDDDDNDDYDPTIDNGRKTKANNTLPIFGNEKTMKYSLI